MIILSTNDFAQRGKYYIPFNENLCGSEEELQSYIDRYEKRFLLDLLGCELAELFISDLIDGVPQQQIYLDIYNSICVDLTTGFNSIYYGHCGCKPRRIISKGIKSMLMGFIFFEFMRDQPFQKGNTGVTAAEAENSSNIPFITWGIDQYYNESIQDYQNIQYFIYENKENYSQFNGVKKEIATSLF